MQMPVIPEIEQATLPDQRQFQLQKLNELLQYLNTHSPYYQKLFQQHPIIRPQLQSLEDLLQFPVTSKEDIQAHNWDFLCLPREQVAEYMATSGTLGRPVTIALSENDLQRLAYNEYLSYGCMGTTAQDTFQLMLTLDKQFMAGLAYYSGIRKLGASLVRTGAGLPQLQWDTIRRLRSNILISVPSFLLKMTQYARENNIDLAASSPKKVLAIGESILAENLAPNALRQKIQEQWDIELFGTYAATEMQTAFTECSAHQGGHHHPELLYLELLDDNNEPVPEGTAGEVTISTFGVEAMPLLRYKTGDICKAYYEPCTCGRNTLRLGPVLGRKKQMIKYKGTTIFPAAIFELLQQSSTVQEYIVEIARNELEQDEVVLHLCSEDEAACMQQLQTAFQSQLRVKPAIRFHSIEVIQKMQMPAQGGRKQVKLIDNRC